MDHGGLYRALLPSLLLAAVACAPPHRPPAPPPASEAEHAPAPVAATAPELEPVATAPEPAAEAPAPAPLALPPIAIHKGTRVLMFGDSMVTSGLGVTLEERVVAQGGKFFHISKPSSTSLTWAEGRALQDLVLRTRPDVVIVVLASNELFVPNPHARAPDVRTIVQRIGARPCLWIGPAPWRPEKGIIGVVRETSKPCRFFDSSSLTLERGPDGIHPTLHGGKTWANAVWQDAFAAE